MSDIGDRVDVRGFVSSNSFRKSSKAAVLDDMMCPVGVPYSFGKIKLFFATTCASWSIVCKLHPNSTVASLGEPITAKATLDDVSAVFLLVYSCL